MNAKSEFAIRLSLICLTILADCLFVVSIHAERPPFKVFTTADGLAHDSVNRIVRDSRGFLWFCTAEGLSRFDGSQFKNYTQNQGLPHRNVNDFLETQDGVYFVATNQGLSVFNPHGRAYRWNVRESTLEQNGSEPPLFQTFVPANADTRQKKNILTLAQTADGSIWAGTIDGLFRVEKNGAEWRFIPFNPEGWQANRTVSTLFADTKGNLLVGTGVIIAADGKWEKFDVLEAASIMEDRDGRIWVGAGGSDAGLRVFENENNSLKIVKTYKKADGLMDEGFQFALTQTADGRIYIGTDKYRTNVR